jgi:hypothetical protein
MNKVLDFIKSFIYNTDQSENNVENNNFYDRMKNLIERNQVYYTKNKYYIVTIKSADLLKDINKTTKISDKLNYIKEINYIWKETSNSIYEKFSPYLIYSCNNEINLVFYSDNLLYNGNITKFVSNITSLITLEFNKISRKEFVFNGYSVEFEEDYECMNYIIWRYHDCIRNISNLLWKCVQTDIDIIFNPNIPTLDIVHRDIKNYINEDYLNGTVYKKCFYINTNDNEECNRKYIKSLNPCNVFNNNFDDNLRELIKTKYLED